MILSDTLRLMLLIQILTGMIYKFFLISEIIYVIHA